MIRVLQIVPTLGYGGVAQFLLNYYKRMDKSEIKFDFITHGKVEAFHEKLISDGSSIFYFDSISQVGLKEYKKQLKNIFYNNHYDIVHTHDGHVTGITAYLCRQYFDGVIICHAHTTLCTNPKHRLFMPVFRFMARKNADILLGCGEMACKYCFGNNSNYTVIHNAVDLERFNNISKEDILNVKENLSIPTESLVVGHVGAFIDQKNHEYIIKIIEQSKDKEIVFVLVGDGPKRRKIEEELRNNKTLQKARFLGKQDNIPLYMNTFDVFILPSLFEGLPVVGIEAQSVGLKCIFSDTIDKDVDVGLGNVTFLPINEKSISIWVEKITEKSNVVDKDLIIKKFIEKGYDIATSVNSLENVYKNCIK